jgi:glycosyltransferase involved in cell wall biosynthesis
MTTHVLLATGVLDVGGLDEVVAFLARRLPGEGLRVSVVHTDEKVPGYSGPGGRLAAQLRDEGVDVARVDPDQLHPHVASLRPDVISAHGAPDRLITAAEQLGIPVVETLHGMHSWYDPTTWEDEAERSRRIAAFVAVSDLVRREYLNCNPTYPERQVVTIPNSVDDSKVPDVDRDQARRWLGVRDEFLFVSLARYVLQKNTYGLVSAFQDLLHKEPDARLLVAGRSDGRAYHEQVSHLRDSLPGADRVHLRADFRHPGLLLAAADCFVLDSFFEGWALASMEALSSGVPVILSEVGGAAEQVAGDERNGIVVPNPAGRPIGLSWETMRAVRFAEQPNRDELVDAMWSMVTAGPRSESDRRDLRRRSLSRFDPRNSVCAHARVLIDVANGRPPSVLATR